MSGNFIDSVSVWFTKGFRETIVFHLYFGLVPDRSFGYKGRFLVQLTFLIRWSFLLVILSIINLCLFIRINKRRHNFTFLFIPFYTYRILVYILLSYTYGTDVRIFLFIHFCFWLVLIRFRFWQIHLYLLDANENRSFLSFIVLVPVPSVVDDSSHGVE